MEEEVEAVPARVQQRRAVYSASSMADKKVQAIEKPHPGIGEKDYLQYIKNNLIYPEEAKKAGIKGVVKLRFTVKKNGKISKIRVIEGIGYGCDKEAIRLIKQGPEWLPGSGDGNKKEMEVETLVKFE